MKGLLRIGAALFLIASLPANAYGPTLDLHAHLFMKEGMSWMFRGGFFDSLSATSWRDRFSSQANSKSMDASGNAIVVATFYAHPLMCLSLRDCVRAQLADVERFVNEDPVWVVAKGAAEAKAALARGKKVLILALEGASGILDTDEDIREFIDRDGISIVTPLHLTDDHFGGVALLWGFKVLSSPIAWIEALFSRSSEILLNPNGLTERGQWLVKSLVAHHVWVDLSHASDRSQAQILPLLGALPLLYTHTTLRKFNASERAISDTALAEVRDSGGFVGLMPSEEMLEGTPTQPPCDQGIFKLAVQFRELAKVIGATSIALGTDTNGGIPHLSPPQNCPTHTRLDLHGWSDISDTASVWSALESLHAPLPPNSGDTLHRFLEIWAQVRP